MARDKKAACGAYRLPLRKVARFFSLQKFYAIHMTNRNDEIYLFERKLCIHRGRRRTRGQLRKKIEVGEVFRQPLLAPGEIARHASAPPRFLPLVCRRILP
jgi:hypothetical protein